MEKKAHKEISRKAVQIYNELYFLKSEQDKELTDRFVKNSGSEDNIISIDLQRLRNWHFYDPDQRLERVSSWFINKSNEKRVDKLIEKIVKSAVYNRQDTYEFAGRLAHHIQDMSCPPHVVPICHGFPFGPNDPFDKYATPTIASVNLSADQLISAKSDQRDLKSADLKTLWKDAAEKTINRVDKGPVIFDGKEIAKNWSGFWRKYQLVNTECSKVPRKGFGCYGKYKFGSKTGPFPETVYKNFYKEQIASSVEDSLRLLVILKKTVLPDNK